MIFKNSYRTRELKGTYCLFKTILYSYIAMWPLVTYSNGFKIISTVAFQVSQTRGMLVLIPYHYTK